MWPKLTEYFKTPNSEKSDKNNKDLTDFFLEEYKNVAQAYFNSHEVTAKWVKFYFIIIATPYSVILFVYKNSPPTSFNFSELPNTISSYFLLTGFVGTLLSFIILNTRLDSTLYARTVNGVRKYFKDIHKLTHQDADIDQYFVLPDNINVPNFMKLGDLTFLVLLMSVINSLYIALGLPQITNSKNVYQHCLSQTTLSCLVFIIVFIIHWFYYYNITNKKRQTYSK